MVLLSLLPFDSTRGPDQKEDPSGDSTAIAVEAAMQDQSRDHSVGLHFALWAPGPSSAPSCCYTENPCLLTQGALVAQQLGTD